VIFPERSVYSDVLEIISPIYLRERLGINDGDQIVVDVEGPMN
jgi:riboflavin kinase